MRHKHALIGLLAASLVLQLCNPVAAQKRPYRIFIVSSYHREYGWSQGTAQGVAEGLVDFKLLQTPEQAEALVRDDSVDTETAIIRKAWMDTKRRNSRADIADSAQRIIDQIEDFSPDLVLLGDDNAVQYLGEYFIDTPVPVVFWGVDGTPLKYGLVDAQDSPGHNITGVYQKGYMRECLECLQKLFPGIKAVAILSDDSETGRAKAKIIQRMSLEGKLPVRLIESVFTDNMVLWQESALRLARDADAFIILNHSTLKSAQNAPVDPQQVMDWYCAAILRPECATELQWVQEGALLTVDDSAYKQGYEAVRMAAAILRDGRDPASMPVVTPARGKIVANAGRARALGVDLSKATFIEEIVEAP